MLNKIKKFTKRPPLFKQEEKEFWNDPHIAKQMLKSHLNNENDGATRNHDFVKQSAAWITNSSPAKKYPNILDLGCGPGIYAEIFKNANYHVTGIDFSHNSINYAKQSAKAKQLDIHYVYANYLEYNLVRSYNLITMIYCDFGALNPTSRNKMLKKIYDALDNEGVFVFDVFTPLHYKDEQEATHWEYQGSGFWSANPYLLLQSLYRYETENTFLNQYIVCSEATTKCYNIWEQVFTKDELSTLLSAVGFKTVLFYDNLLGNAYTNNTTMAVIAYK